MKHWNKDRDVRKRCWTRVKLEPPAHSVNVKKWCQNQPGGKYYYDYHTNSWWFERGEDAMMFSLRWS